MTAVKPGRAAAAEMPMGVRLQRAGGGLCTTCRHPARLHAGLGCACGDCFCVSPAADLIAEAGATVEVAVETAVAPPSAAQLALLDGLCSCGHVRTKHKVAGSSVICRVCACHAFTVPAEETTDASAAPPAEPAPPSVAAAPASAVASAAPAGPVGEPPAPRPVAVELPPWLPGAGVPRVKRQPVPIVEVTTPDEDVARQVDDIVAAGKAAARKRPRRTPTRPAVSPALVSAAVVGERDAVEEVTAAILPAAVTDPPEPEPLDYGPFLARALWVSARWYCPHCHSWPANTGACLTCSQPLQAVYLVTVPREIP